MGAGISESQSASRHSPSGESSCPTRSPQQLPQAVTDDACVRSAAASARGAQDLSLPARASNKVLPARRRAAARLMYRRSRASISPGLEARGLEVARLLGIPDQEKLAPPPVSARIEPDGRRREPFIRPRRSSESRQHRSNSRTLTGSTSHRSLYLLV